MLITLGNGQGGVVDGELGHRLRFVTTKKLPVRRFTRTGSRPARWKTSQESK
jgi:hypothetical protein